MVGYTGRRPVCEARPTWDNPNGEYCIQHIAYRMDLDGAGVYSRMARVWTAKVEKSGGEMDGCMNFRWKGTTSSHIDTNFNIVLPIQ